MCQKILAGFRTGIASRRPRARCLTFCPAAADQWTDPRPLVKNKNHQQHPTQSGDVNKNLYKLNKIELPPPAVTISDRRSQIIYNNRRRIIRGAFDLHFMPSVLAFTSTRMFSTCRLNQDSGTGGGKCTLL